MRICRGALAVVLCAALGCGGPQGPARPAPLVGRTLHYQPLGMKADAALPGQAVILGTDDADGSTVLPLPIATSTAVVHAMVVERGGAEPATGRWIAITLTTSPAPPPAVVPAPPAASPPAAVPPGTPPPTVPATPPGTPPGSAATATPPPTVPSAAPATVPATPPPTVPATPPGSAATATPPPTVPGTAPATAATASPPVPAIRAPQVGAGDPAAGARWRAGLWSAALVAATTLGKDLHDVTFSAVPASPIDSAAASALIAAGFLATLTGAPIDPQATLAGTLDPDGTIGPAAGIPEQFLGALGHGKTRLGYPSGMRLARSQVTGKDVDLVQLAKDHHAEAIELANVYDAYQLLTRHALPAPVPVGEADMALDPDTLGGLDAAYLAWRARLAGEWTQLLHLEQAGRLPATVGVLTRLAQDLGEQAEVLYRAGKLPAAYGRVLAAWVSAAGANATYAVLAKLAAGDVDGAVAALAARDTADPGAILGKLGALRPATLSGHLAMVAAFQPALRGWSYHGFGAEALRATTQLLAGLQGKSAAELGSAATAERIAGTLAPAVLMRLRTIAETTVADQELALEPDQGVPYTGSPPHVARLAAAFQAEAAAALRHADALLVAPLARAAGITDDAARRRVAAAWPDYLIADALARLPSGDLPRQLAASWGEGSVAWSLLLLAGHAAAYHTAAFLLAKYDALAVHVDDAGRIDAVEHPEAFRALLANAGRTARATARAARIATGTIPVQARLAYQLAAVEQTGSLDDQVNALADLWAASAFCRIAVMLARH
jgi:hypothetical protein